MKHLVATSIAAPSVRVFHPNLPFSSLSLRDSTLEKLGSQRVNHGPTLFNHCLELPNVVPTPCLQQKRL